MLPCFAPKPKEGVTATLHVSCSMAMAILLAGGIMRNIYSI